MNLPWDSKERAARENGEYVRPESDPLYHTVRWTKLSRRWRIAHPLCEECKRNGVIKAADCVDHIVPWPICEDFFDERNLQSLCSKCNQEKGYKDRPLIQKWRRDHPGGGKNR